MSICCKLCLVIIACVFGTMFYGVYEFCSAMKCHRYMGEEGRVVMIDGGCFTAGTGVRFAKWTACEGRTDCVQSVRRYGRERYEVRRPQRTNNYVWGTLFLSLYGMIVVLATVFGLYFLYAMYCFRLPNTGGPRRGVICN